MMYKDLKVNETLKIGDVVIKLLDKSGRVARLAIDVDKGMEIVKIPSVSLAPDHKRD